MGSFLSTTRQRFAIAESCRTTEERFHFV